MLLGDERADFFLLAPDPSVEAGDIERARAVGGNVAQGNFDQPALSPSVIPTGSSFASFIN
jgi:hypothetical protein